MGFGNSINIGGNTAGFNGGIGDSNCGDINDNGSCFKFNFFYNSTLSGTKLVSNLNKSLLNNLVKSNGKSSFSCKQLFNWLDNDPISGIYVISFCSTSSF